MLCEFIVDDKEVFLPPVLILVLMEDALRVLRQSLKAGNCKVSILVLMEDALREPLSRHLC